MQEKLKERNQVYTKQERLLNGQNVNHFNFTIILNIMTTINQLVKKPRQDKNRKSKSPALQTIKNSIKRSNSELACPQKR